MIAELAIDLHEHLIQAPAPLRIAPHVRYPLLPDLGSEDGAKPVPPKPDCLVADPALGQQILDVAQATAGTSLTSLPPGELSLANC